MTPCTEHDRICKIEERIGKGDVHFGTITQTLNDVHTLAVSMNKRLFIDNGTKSVQSRINAVENVTTVLIWIAGVLIVCTVTLIGQLILEAVKKHV